jgi:hypothetical protein
VQLHDNSFKIKIKFVFLFSCFPIFLGFLFLLFLALKVTLSKVKYPFFLDDIPRCWQRRCNASVHWLGEARVGRVCEQTGFEIDANRTPSLPCTLPSKEIIIIRRRAGLLLLEPQPPLSSGSADSTTQALQLGLTINIAVMLCCLTFLVPIHSGIKRNDT